MKACVRVCECQGVKVCKGLDPEVKRKEHVHVTPTDSNVLESIQLPSSIEEDARKKVCNLAKAVLAREKFCPAQIYNVETDLLSSCQVHAKVMNLHAVGRKPFLGCSGYKPTQPGECTHYEASQRYEMDIIHNLDDLHTGRQSLSGSSGVACKFVQAKMKSKCTCSLCGFGLEEISCSADPSDPKAQHTMVTIEPELGVHVPRHKKVLYVACFNAHTHPPRPHASPTPARYHAEGNSTSRFFPRTRSQKDDRATETRSNEIPANKWSSGTWG